MQRISAEVERVEIDRFLAEDTTGVVEVFRAQASLEEIDLLDAAILRHQEAEERDLVGSPCEEGDRLGLTNLVRSRSAMRGMHGFLKFGGALLMYGVLLSMHQMQAVLVVHQAELIMLVNNGRLAQDRSFQEIKGCDEKLRVARDRCDIELRRCEEKNVAETRECLAGKISDRASCEVQLLAVGQELRDQSRALAVCHNALDQDFLKRFESDCDNEKIDDYCSSDL